MKIIWVGNVRMMALGNAKMLGLGMSGCWEVNSFITKLYLQGADLDTVTMDETGIKKTLLAFEKKTTRNQELRIKFPDQPERFSD